MGRDGSDWSGNISKRRRSITRPSQQDLCWFIGEVKRHAGSDAVRNAYEQRNAYVHAPSADPAQAHLYLAWHHFEEQATRLLAHSEPDLILVGFHARHSAGPFPVPTFCEWLMCVAVEPEFQKDRLADYQERFNGLWVRKFGYRGAIAVYLWHVLRQSTLIDWLVRTCRVLVGS